ncbi:MAG TPA: isocitrate lyase/phosphoenolpyruvate mutase family protein, partial [Thermopolyspora sp.]
QTLLVIARTDALHTEGIEPAIERARAYADAGADLILVHGADSRDRLRQVHRALPAVPLVHLMGAAHPDAEKLTPHDLADGGVGVIIHPTTALLAGAASMRDAYRELMAGGATTSPGAMSWPDFTSSLICSSELDGEPK